MTQTRRLNSVVACHVQQHIVDVIE